MSALAFGPWLVSREVGRGGMGVVYLGRHRDGGLPVAIKRTLVAAGPRARDAFHAEARAMAGLDHPNVVRVLDRGDDADDEPWLVMEWASEGTLAERPPESWTALQELLVLILDALAHAHARGVVHRDLKPGNVLLCGPGDDRPGAKLADFGIATALGAESSVAGTPAYMAPEQVAGRWRDVGPWTDLYALGCTAFELATGELPFRGASPGAIARARLTESPIPLLPRIPVPAGFEDWTRRLLARSPADRTRFAADAARDLLALGAPVDADAVHAWRASTTHTFELAGTAITETDGPEEPLGPASAVPVATAGPFPPTWRRSRHALPSIEAFATGLALWGQRSAPFVGRSETLDRLWDVLRDAARGHPRAVVVRGAAGVGKSRLAAEWGQRAHELGAADVIRAEGSVAGALRRAWGLVGLEGEVLRSAVADRLDAEPVDAAAIADALDGRGLAGLRRGLELAARRPLLVVVDGDPDGPRLAAEVLDNATGPVVVAVVVPDQPTWPGAAAAERLARATGAEALTLAALGPEVRDLVDGLLPLARDLAERVAQASGGHPGLAVDLVGQLVRGGRLVPGPDGYALRPGAPLPDPTTGRRVDVVGHDGRDVELAAVLGPRGGWDELDAALEAAGLHRDRALWDRLADQGVVHWTAEGWGFTDEPGRRAWLARAAETGRLAAWHDVGALIATDPERRGRHLVGAGRAVEALDPLYDAARERVLAGAWDQALALASEAFGTPLPTDDPRWGRWWLLRTDVALQQTRLDDAERFAELARGLAVDASGRAQAAHRLANVRRFRGDYGGAVALVEATDADDPEASPRRAERRMLWAELHLQRGQLDAAARGFAEARELAVALGLDTVVGRADERLATLALARGDHAGARALYLAARERLEAAGAPWIVAVVENALGELARHAGQVDDALDAYRRALALLRARGGGDAALVELNLAVTLSEADRHVEAQPLFHRCVRELERRGRAPFAAAARISSLPTLAAVEDWHAFEVAVELGADGLARTGLADPQIAADADRGARLAEAAGHHASAAAARAVAEAQRAAMQPG